jgi:glutathione S-transferase
MFAPVVARFLTYAPPLTEASLEYCHAVRAHAQVDAWYRAAAEEPESWRLDKYESLRKDFASAS